MTRLLLMEGNVAARRARAKSLGMRTSSEIYVEAILAHFPEIEIDVVNGADADFNIPHGRGFSDYDGFVVSGSALHAYDTDFAVTNQIEVLKQAAEAGLPVFGSCWGLQIAAMAGGGTSEAQTGQHLRPAGRFLIQYFLAGPFQRPLDTRHPGGGQQREMRGGAAQHFGGDLLQLRQAAVTCGDPLVEHLVGKIAAHHRGYTDGLRIDWPCAHPSMRERCEGVA